MTLVTIHQKLGVALLLILVVGSGFAVVASRRGSQLPAVRAYVRLCEAAVGIQVLLGLILLATGHSPKDALHFFYGAATLLSPPIAVRIGRGGQDRREALVLAIGVFCAFLFAIRALGTGA
jgi:hypothetical protein